MFGLTTLLVREVSITGHRQRRSQNKAEEAMPPPEKLVKIYRWCFISISTVRKQTEGTVGLVSCSLTDQGLT